MCVLMSERLLNTKINCLVLARCCWQMQRTDGHSGVKMRAWTSCAQKKRTGGAGTEGAAE